MFTSFSNDSWDDADGIAVRHRNIRAMRGTREAKDQENRKHVVCGFFCSERKCRKKKTVLPRGSLKKARLVISNWVYKWLQTQVFFMVISKFF